MNMAKEPEKPKKSLTEKLMSLIRSLIRSAKRAVRRKKIHAVGEEHHHHHHKHEEPSVFARVAAVPPVSWMMDGLRWLRSKLLVIAEGKALSNLIVGCIMINTVLMAIDHSCDFYTDDYCYKFKGSLEAFNVAFCFIFFSEMVIKTGGFGLVRYFSDVYVQLPLPALKTCNISVQVQPLRLLHRHNFPC